MTPTNSHCMMEISVNLSCTDITLHVIYDLVSSLKNIMKIEIRFTLVHNENWLLANVYALTSINKRLKKKNYYVTNKL